MKTSRIVGISLLVLGLLALIACILLAFAVGTVAVPILLIFSILANSVGITLLRRR